MPKNKFLWSGVAFAVGILLSFVSVSRRSEKSDESIPAHYRPSKELSPLDVVRRQLTALQNCGEEPDAFRWCYQFASPSNRARVGSLEQFTEMLGDSTYRPLIGHREHLVGRPTIVADEATLLVTVINEDGVPSVFRFQLRRQELKPFDQCWMTTAVFPATDLSDNSIDRPNGSDGEGYSASEMPLQEGGNGE